MASLSSNLKYGLREILHGIIGDKFYSMSSSASYFLEGFSGFLGFFSIVYTICTVLLLCYFGYCIFRTILAIHGFIAGAASGAVLGLVIAFSNSEYNSLGSYMMIGALIVGIIGCILALLLYKLGVFMFFSSGTFLIVFLNIVFGFGGKFGPSMVASVIIGFIVGIIAVIVDKYFIIAGTATIGACNGGILIMMMNTNGPMGLITALILLVSGIIVQVKLTKKLATKTNAGPKRKKAPVQHTAPAPAPTFQPAQGSIAPDFGTPAYTTPNSAPDLSTAPVNSAPDYSTAPIAAIRCPGCGNPSEPGERFCSSCGRPLN